MMVTEVIQQAERALNALLGAIEGFDSQDLTNPGTIGEWSIKDVLNHIIAWEEEVAAAFEIWKVGIEPDWSYITDLDEFNANNVRQRKKLPVAKVKEQLNLIHHGVLENIKSVPDDEFARRGGVPRWLVTQITSHVEEHTRRILEFKESLLMVPGNSAQNMHGIAGEDSF